jgi:hypothetical protein
MARTRFEALETELEVDTWLGIQERAPWARTEGGKMGIRSGVEALELSGVGPVNWDEGRPDEGPPCVAKAEEGEVHLGKDGVVVGRTAVPLVRPAPVDALHEATKRLERARLRWK